MEKEIRFCSTADGDAIAYTIFGQGSLMVVPPGWVSHLEQQWMLPGMADFFLKLSRRHTVVMFDKLGTGLSDRNRDDFTLEKDLADMSVVIDAAGHSQFDLFGFSMGGPLALAYAAEYPERVDHLILYGTFAKGGNISTPEMKASLISLIRSSWGLGSNILSWLFVPHKSEDPDAAEKISRFQRDCADAETAARLLELFYKIDVTGLLPDIRIPALVIHRRRDRAIPAIWGQKLAAGIPDARFSMLEGDIHFPWLGDTGRLLGVIAGFLGDPEAPQDQEPVLGKMRPAAADERPDSAGFSRSTDALLPPVLPETGGDPDSGKRGGPYHFIYHDLLQTHPGIARPSSRVGIAQIGLDIDFLEDRGDGLFTLSPAGVESMRQKVAAMIDQAGRRGVNILAFPEMTVDMSHQGLSSLIFSAAREYGMLIIPGSFHDPDSRANVSMVIGPEGILWEQEKHIPAIISLGGRKIREGIRTRHPRKVIIANTQFGRVAVAICRDFLDMDLRVELKNFSPPVDIVINPALTPVTADFEAAHLEARRSVYAYFFFCNVAGFGNSLIHSPEKGKRKLTLPPNKEGLLFKDIDLFNLRAERRKWEKIRESKVRFIQSTR